MPTYAENTPESRIAQLARQGLDLPEDEVLRRAGYMHGDGPGRRGDLLAQYHAESAAAGFEAAAVASGAYDAAFGDWRTTVADARAYSEHAASAFRSGEPQQEYGDFLAARRADHEAI
jgi:hypothetical protein